MTLFFEKEEEPETGWYSSGIEHLTHEPGGQDPCKFFGLDAHWGHRGGS